MNIQIYFYLENQGYTVFAQNEGNQLKRVGRINQYKNCYQNTTKSGSSLFKFITFLRLNFRMCHCIMDS